MSVSVQPPILPPPVTVPTGAEAWFARRFGLPPAVAMVIRDLAFPACPSWQRRRT